MWFFVFLASAFGSAWHGCWRSSSCPMLFGPAPVAAGYSTWERVCMLPEGQGGMVFVDYDYQDQNHNWSGTSSAPNSEQR